MHFGFQSGRAAQVGPASRTYYYPIARHTERHTSVNREGSQAGTSMAWVRRSQPSPPLTPQSSHFSSEARTERALASKGASPPPREKQRTASPPFPLKKMQALRLKSLDAREAFSKQVVQGRTDKGTQERLKRAWSSSNRSRERNPLQVHTTHHFPSLSPSLLSPPMM